MLTVFPVAQHFLASLVQEASSLHAPKPFHKLTSLDGHLVRVLSHFSAILADKGDYRRGKLANNPTLSARKIGVVLICGKGDHRIARF